MFNLGVESVKVYIFDYLFWNTIVFYFLYPGLFKGE